MTVLVTWLKGYPVGKKNNGNNKRICVAPWGRNQRRWGQAVCYWEEGREKAREKRNVFSLDLNTVTESLLTAVFGSELQTAGAEHR